MIKYDFLDYDTYSANYINGLKDVYELVIDKHQYAYYNTYVVCYQPIKSDERIIFSCNNKCELKIWLDLNGFKLQTCKIFYKKTNKIEYASIILRKPRDEI